MSLSVCLLNEEDPQLVAVAPREHGASIGKAGEVVIQNYVLPFSILAESQLVDP